jgi:hypothetical protein
LESQRLSDQQGSCLLAHSARDWHLCIAAALKTDRGETCSFLCAQRDAEYLDGEPQRAYLFLRERALAPNSWASSNRPRMAGSGANSAGTCQMNKLGDDLQHRSPMQCNAYLIEATAFGQGLYGGFFRGFFSFSRGNLLKISVRT